jgi:hypothetical protein
MYDTEVFTKHYLSRSHGCEAGPACFYVGLLEITNVFEVLTN